MELPMTDSPLKDSTSLSTQTVQTSDDYFEKRQSELSKKSKAMGCRLYYQYS